MENPTTAAEPQIAVPRRTILTAMGSWARDLAVSVILAVLVILFVYQPVKVEGTSMMPSLVDQERIFINKFVYRFGMGGIDPSKSYIKRVIGLPGDTVEVDHGSVIVNGRKLKEDYVPEEYRDRSTMSAYQVAEDEYFVLGDHRSSSNDSRSWGCVPRTHIYGKAVFVYWPLDKIGVLR
jgi:signal peptidase I